MRTIASLLAFSLLLAGPTMLAAQEEDAALEKALEVPDVDLPGAGQAPGIGSGPVDGFSVDGGAIGAGEEPIGGPEVGGLPVLEGDGMDGELGEELGGD